MVRLGNERPLKLAPDAMDQPAGTGGGSCFLAMPSRPSVCAPTFAGR
jgi:hypothetical protein